MAYLRDNDPEVGNYRLLTADPDGSNETILQIGPANNSFPQGVAWSPDGNRIAYDVFFFTGETAAINVFDITRRHVDLFCSFKDKALRELQWASDGRTLLVLLVMFGNKGNFFRTQVREISYPDGKFSAITHVQRGLIPYVRIQSNVRFLRSQILDWITDHNYQPKGFKR